jgi:hypothetical protein
VERLFVNCSKNEVNGYLKLELFPKLTTLGIGRNFYPNWKEESDTCLGRIEVLKVTVDLRNTGRNGWPANMMNDHRGVPAAINDDPENLGNVPFAKMRNLREVFLEVSSTGANDGSEIGEVPGSFASVFELPHLTAVKLSVPTGYAGDVLRQIREDVGGNYVPQVEVMTLIGCDPPVPEPFDEAVSTIRLSNFDRRDQ